MSTVLSAKAKHHLSEVLGTYVDGLDNPNGDRAREIGLAEYTGTNPENRHQIYTALANVCGFQGPDPTPFPDSVRDTIRSTYPSANYRGFLLRSQRTGTRTAPQMPALVTPESSPTKEVEVIDLVEVTSDNDYDNAILTRRGESYDAVNLMKKAKAFSTSKHIRLLTTIRSTYPSTIYKRCVHRSERTVARTSPKMPALVTHRSDIECEEYQAFDLSKCFDNAVDTVHDSSSYFLYFVKGNMC
jgi:hypothetical protein